MALFGLSLSTTTVLASITRQALLELLLSYPYVLALLGHRNLELCKPLFTISFVNQVESAWISTKHQEPK